MRRSAPTRRSTPATPAAARTRSAPRHPALGLSGRQLGLDDPRDRRAPAAPSGARSTSTPSPSTPPDSRSGAARSPASSPPRRRSAATARSTSAPSTASSTPSTPTPARIAGASHRRSHLRLAGAGPGRPGQDDGDYVGSADGSIYALRPDGSLLWRYDTGDVIRSSPVVGQAPNGRGRDRLRRLLQRQAVRDRRRSGRRRWSFDTTPPSGSCATETTSTARPALGRRGIYIGGEHGLPRLRPLRLLPAPPRSPLRAAARRGVRQSVDRVFCVTPGGTTVRRPEGRVPAATVLGTRLIVRRAGVDRRAPGWSRPTPRARPRQPAVPLPHPALRRRAVPLHPP